MTIKCPQCGSGSIAAGYDRHQCVNLSCGLHFDAVPGESALDVQTGGDHYKNMKIQPVEYIHANGLGFLEGCVIKYVSRFRNKNGRQDLEKAKHFIDLLIQLEYPNE